MDLKVDALRAKYQAEKLEAIAAALLSFVLETYSALPAVSARTFSINLFFLINFDD